jgi:hypothetical protein
LLKLAKDSRRNAVVSNVNGVLEQCFNEVDMEINGASASAYNSAYERPIAISKSTSIAGGEGAINVYVITPDTVDISPEAAARAYAGSSDDAGDDGDSDTADGAEASDDSDNVEAADSKPADGGADPSTPKSFVYGALGLERPEQTQNKSTDGYDFGRWVSAGVTIGTIISVLI